MRCRISQRPYARSLLVRIVLVSPGVLQQGALERECGRAEGAEVTVSSVMLHPGVAHEVLLSTESPPAQEAFYSRMLLLHVRQQLLPLLKRGLTGLAHKLRATSNDVSPLAARGGATFAWHASAVLWNASFINLFLDQSWRGLCAKHVAAVVGMSTPAAQ